MMIDHMVSCTFTSADHGRFGYSGNAARSRQSKRMGRFQVSRASLRHRPDHNHNLPWCVFSEPLPFTTDAEEHYWQSSRAMS